MKILANVHISPRTVEFLRARGHDVCRVGETVSFRASDREVIAAAAKDSRVILTQDLDYSDLLALGKDPGPPLITLRLSSSRIEHVNEVLGRVLASLVTAPTPGTMITVTDKLVRIKAFPDSTGKDE